VWLPLFATLSGCVMPDQLAQYQKDVAELQQSLASVTKTQADDGKRIAALEAKTGGDDTVKRSEIADLKAQQDTVVRQSTATADRVDQLNTRVERLSQDVAAARDVSRRTALVPVPPPSGSDAGAASAAAATMPPGAVPAAAIAAGAAPSAAAPVANPSALYTSAYADFSKGNYALAISGFEEYARSFPETELADNAMYWIGECQFSQGSYKAAVDAFDAMLEKYPKSDKAAAANLKKALAFVQLNQIGQGIEQLRFVTANYPGTDEARIASDRLSALGKP
jgi:tol-pal system protein YbgF